MAYLALAYTILQSYMRDIGENIKLILTSAYDLHGVIRLLRQTPEVDSSLNLPPLKIRGGEVRFADIDFQYPAKAAPIFKQLSLTINAGERVALIGPSGGGKTSFIRLLQCLYPIQGGHIYIDRQDLALHSRHSLRSALALVPQEPILFHRTLRENIAYARPEASTFEVEAAAQKAQIHEFILSLPEQYETLVGERGIKLSGGERQRVAIARAILADRPILILDEATSSLDSKSERAIQEALHTLMSGRTSIIIAHRLSTLLDADRIVVFDQGQIVEIGTHQELLAKAGGIYANLLDIQTGSRLKPGKV
jgi:ATP-binding cassette subfamily B protein